MEYVGYGVYKGNSDEKRIKEDSERLLNYLLYVMNIKIENIRLIGRCMGSSICLYLSSKYSGFKNVILISPFLSINNIIIDKYPIMKYIVNEHDNNFDNMKLI